MKYRFKTALFTVLVVALTVLPATAARADIFWWIRKVAE